MSLDAAAPAVSAPDGYGIPAGDIIDSGSASAAGSSATAQTGQSSSSQGSTVLISANPGSDAAGETESADSGAGAPSYSG